jgi:DNA-binding GntR family transcriptional regulator
MVTRYHTMQEIVTGTIHDAILSGRYPPGHRLIAEEVAQELGVSRMPVREALHRLEVAGLVTMVPHRGAVVSELSEQEIVEIYHIRAVLDGLAARLATPHVTAADHQQLTVLLDQMEAAVKAKNMDRLLVVNRKFHQVIWKAAGAPRLLALLENLYDTSQRFRNLSLLIPGRNERITHEHRLIAQALQRGDSTAAERYANEHYEGTAQQLLASIEKKNVEPPASKPRKRK